MRRHRKSVLTLASAVLIGLAGCNRPEEPATPPPPEPTPPIAEAAPVTAVYICDSGLTVAVAWPDAQSVQLTWRDRTYVLRSTQTATGARYRDAEVEWRSITRDGVEQATLSRIVEGDATVVLERCRRPAPAPAAPVPAPADPTALLPVAAPCKGPQLRLSNDGGDAGMGHRRAIIGVQNIGARACSLTGYPTVSLQDAGSRPLPTVRTDQHPGSYLRSGENPVPVELAPQGRAFFDLAWTVVPNEAQGETTCPSAARIRMIAPGDTSPTTLGQVFTPCGGRIEVSPFRAVAEPAPVPAT